MSNSKGPLAGLRVLEMAAIGPVPFAGMVLADMGADVVRVDRPGPPDAFPGVA
ncbi:CoA transferase, partial [Bradyrhizobium sp. NBAIM08]|uniref:CoA transferase n=1 Tax=Bradyrhizobium sp. NBAIM08 TaxID=2793815 RepID=UPI001CD257A8